MKTGAARQFGLFLQWQARRQARALPIYAILQALMAAAVALGYGLIIGDVDHATGLYLTTGATTVALLMLGLVIAPQTISATREEGGYEWLMTLPIARLVFLLADMVVWMAMALPGVVLGVLVGSWRYGLTVAPTWFLAPAVVLVSLTATALGYAIAVSFGRMGTILFTQLFIIGTMLFTPITYPAERLPDWLAEVHRWLPFEAFGQLIRFGFAPDHFPIGRWPWGVVGVWCCICIGLALAALRRRK